MIDLDKGFTQDIIAACQKHKLSKRDTAYVLATAHHETGGAMMPIKETVMPWHDDKNPTDRTVINRLDRAFAKGQLTWVSAPYWREGWFGRGFVQLTHKSNYKKASDETGVDLVSDPSRALNPTVAATILVKGMRDGWFTGKKLSDYTTFRNMRRVVNGMDKADTIAALAEQYLAALPDNMSAQKPKPSIWALIMSLFK